MTTNVDKIVETIATKVEGDPEFLRKISERPEEAFKELKAETMGIVLTSKESEEFRRKLEARLPDTKTKSLIISSLLGKLN